MKTFKFIILIELVAIFLTAVVHFVTMLLHESFPLNTYPLMCGIVLICMLFVIFILDPLADRFLN
jgi:hypothetical protein